MTIQEFIRRITTEFGFEPTADQAMALQVFARFLADRRPDCVMVLRGSAGTGKTSLAGAMMRTLRRLGQKLLLMAPTGRAAKVLSQNSGFPAYTIHRKIYREKAYQGLDGQFNLSDNRYHNTLFVVDEASMISHGASDFQADGSAPAAFFGSGSLLDDLVKYVYSGDNCRLLLIGDKAQLPLWAKMRRLPSVPACWRRMACMSISVTSMRCSARARTRGCFTTPPLSGR